MQRKILVVDDGDINRRILKNMLQDDYDVLEAENGEQALQVLRRSYEHVSAVLLDIVMPEMDGYEVLKRMRDDANLSPIPVIVATGNTEAGAEIKALSLGANDFIMKPYNPAIIKHRLWNTINLRETAAIVNRATKDRLTGLYNRETFFEKAAEMIAAKESGYYVLSCQNIDSFKVINDLYGSAKGDEVLRRVAQAFSRGFEPIGGICCRITSDNFAVLYPSRYMDTQVLADIRQEASTPDSSMPSIVLSTGRYLVNDKSLPVSAMYDRAIIAEAAVKGRFDVHVAQYDESMREHLLREQEIISEMNDALETGQFEAWYQPQYNHSSGALIGAEALVRWRHPKKGIIPPYQFIPIFERNGFIYELDKCVWEQVCQQLRKHIDAGYLPLPVSVNISRYDMFTDDFFEVITGLLEKYGIPASLLRLEITESAFAKSIAQMIDMVKRLINFGFTIEIDDFGSGYSSLNTLKDVPANILKLDMRFLENSENSQRGGNILESVVRMAKWLGLSVIAEGVETQEQADFLKSIGCNYVQGYLYAKPMPLTDYETLSERADKEDEMFALQTLDSLDNNAFWDPSSMETLIFNSYVGGACIFEYYDGEIELLRANEKYAQELGLGISMEEAMALDLSKHLDADNLKILFNNIENAIATNAESTCETCMTNLPNGSKREYIRATVRVIARAGARMLLYCSIVNTTAQREAEENERETAERIKAIMANVNGGITATIISDRQPRFLFVNDQYYAQLGYTKEQLEAEVDNVFDLVHPDDRERVIEQTAHASMTKKPFTCIYRVIRRDGSIVWMQSNISIFHFPDIDDPVQLSVANDITAQKETEQRMQETSDHLKAIMENVNGGVSAVTFDEDGKVNIVFANDKYYSMFGYTKQLLEAELGDAFKLVHPDDMDRIRKTVGELLENRRSTTYEYRCVKRDGEIVYARCNASITAISGIGDTVLLSVTTDITAEKEYEQQILESSQQLQFLNDISRALLTDDNSDLAIKGVLTRVLNYFDGDRAYVFEMDYIRKCTDNTYEICAAGVAPMKDMLVGIPLDTIPAWFEAFEHNNHISISNVDALDPSRAAEQRILAEQDIDSLVAVPLRRDGVLIGFMGVDNPRHRQSHTDHLEALGDYMAVMLTRRDLNAKIETDNENLTRLMDDTPGGFARMKLMPDGTLAMVYANDGFRDLLGMTQNEMLSTYRADVLAGVHSDDVERVRTAIASAASSNGRFNVKHRFINGVGEYVWVMAFGRLTENERGERFFNMYYADISEQEKRELSYREMLPVALAAVMESSTDIVFVKDKDLNYICCSHAFAQMTGLENERDVAGKTDYDLFSAELADYYRERNTELIKSGQSEVDIVEQFPTRDGVIRYVSYSRYLLRDEGGNIIGLYGIGRDITENRETFTRLKLLSDSIPGGLGMYEVENGKARTLYLSEGVYSITGYEKSEFDALTQGDPLRMIIKDDLPILSRQLNVLINKNIPVDCTCRIRAKDGGYRWLNIQGAPSERSGGRVIVNAVMLDVTGQKLAEEAERIHEEEMKLAMSQMGKMICLFDVATRTLTMPEAYAKKHNDSANTANIDITSISEVVAESSRDAYREFFDSILRGDKAGSAEVYLKCGNGEWCWERYEFISVFDSDGKPVKAIISVEDTTQQHMKDDENKEIKTSERVLQLVAAHSNRRIFRYDIATKSAYANAEFITRDFNVVTNLPESLIEAGKILPESVDDFRKMFADIDSGVPGGSAIIHISDDKHVPHWMDIRYSVIYTDEQVPESAVISILDITESHEKELAYERYRQTIAFNESAGTGLVFMEADITAGITEKLGGAMIPTDVDLAGHDRAEVIDYFVRKRIAKEDWSKCREYFSTARLTALYASGVRRMSEDWRVVLENGELGYYRSELQMVQDPYSGHIKSYTLLSDITEEKLSELNMKKQAQTDGMTDLLNKTTTEQLIKQRLAQTDGMRYALLVADLDNLKLINDSFGHVQGDSAITLMADTLRSQFRQDDIIGRIGGDEFAALIGYGNESRLHGMLAAFMLKLAAMRVGENKDVQIRCSIGIAIGTAGVDTYEELFKKADKALYHVKRNGKDDYAIYTPEMEQAAYRYTGTAEAVLWRVKALDDETLNNLFMAISVIYPLVISINLTQNMYFLMQYDNPAVAKFSDAGPFDELIRLGAETYDAQDREAFISIFSRENLLDAHARGESCVSHEGWQMGSDGVYRFIHTDAILLQSKANNDILAISLSREIKPGAAREHS